MVKVLRCFAYSCLIFLIGCSSRSSVTNEAGQKTTPAEVVDVDNLLTVYWAYSDELTSDAKYLNKLVVSSVHHGGNTSKNPTTGKYSVCLCVWADKAFEADVVCELSPECAKQFATISSKRGLSIKGICKGRVANPANHNGYEVRFVDCEIFEPSPVAILKIKDVLDQGAVEKYVDKFIQIHGVILRHIDQSSGVEIDDDGSSIKAFIDGPKPRIGQTVDVIGKLKRPRGDNSKTPPAIMQARFK